MGRLNIDILSAPKEIKDSLKLLSAHIDFQREVTKGSNGYLYFGFNTILRRKVAVKYYYWGGDKAYHAEPSNLVQIKSEAVIEIFTAGLSGSEWAYFVTPHFRNGDLEDLIGSTSIGTKSAVTFVSQILTGLTHLHGSSFLHRDLKPQNIFIGDAGQALIGDFGSVRALPRGATGVPGSGHSILYRPPESFETGVYGKAGDIYQVGILLYQLLGGFLPYDEISWLTNAERRRYDNMPDPVDRTIFADQILGKKICKGKILRMATLPPWVTADLRRTINKACNCHHHKRFESATAMFAQLQKIKATMGDWNIIEGHPTRFGNVKYRIIPGRKDNSYKVEKCKNAGWRADNNFPEDCLEEQVKNIEIYCSA